MSTADTADTADNADTTKTVVIVDDDPDTAELCAFILREAGSYRVVVETDSAHALETIRTAQPDLVLTDVQMPEVDGFRLYDLLQAGDGLGTGANTGTKRIPVLFMTGNGRDPRFEERGITRWIDKPFTVPELVTAVSEASNM